jgi:hypothetical protein
MCCSISEADLKRSSHSGHWNTSIRILLPIDGSGNPTSSRGRLTGHDPKRERAGVEMRVIKILLVSAVVTVLGAGPALACGGLVAPNGSVNLVRTTTLAAYVDGVERYMTSFEFAGAGKGKFGSIVPLPDVPTQVRKAGRWTLQRLVEEVQPRVFALADGEAAGAAEDRSAKVLFEKEVSALDVTVLEGGGDEVGRWAKENGFFLPPDAPEVLDFYAERSPIFMAVRFDLGRAAEKNLSAGDGIPIQVTIPTDQPWVPLRILGLGRQADEIVEADVFLLNEEQPALLPAPAEPGAIQGLVRERSEPASDLLLQDLASDKRMGWLPTDGMWLDYIRINTPAGELDHDLALDVSGGVPSYVDAGLAPGSGAAALPTDPVMWWPWVLAALFAGGVLVVTGRMAGSR